MIKYIGSKRRLAPVIADLVEAAAARTAIDLFTGTTRVAQEMKRRGVEVWAVDLARYAAVLAGCFVATDAACVDRGRLDAALAELDALDGVDGYVTSVFCEQARYFQPHNGRRIDAIRSAIAERHTGDPLEPVLLTALLLAADRVDSTTGVQMAYLKQWSARSHKRLTLSVPALLPGPGHAVHGDAVALARTLPGVDVAYLDPPYNQHRYVSNYHVWETIVAWDAPEHYGVACKRTDIRYDDALRSPFNDRRRAAAALESCLADIDAGMVVVSCSDEGWLRADDVADLVAARTGPRGAVAVLGFPSARYVGARIGIHNPKGERVGEVGRTTNVEHLVIGGTRRSVRAAAEVGSRAAS